MPRATLLLLGSLLGISGLILGQQRVPDSIFVAAATDPNDGQPVIPNIADPQAVNPQTVCPGYRAVDVTSTANGLTADLTLAESDSHDLAAKSDIEFSWSNDPTFSFKVTRKSTSDILFTTENSQIVYEDQFIEFGSSLPENYNLYGLGEVIHGFRLGNNFTRTFFAADVGDVIDANIYGDHPFYLDTRYFEVDEKTGGLSYATDATDPSLRYKSFSHGVFQRNAHPQEVLLRESNITWRALGGGIDLYFYEGPTQDEITQAYQKSAVGLPAMQQYWTFGYHQCRWGYDTWLELQDVLDNFEKFEIPLETIWSDIDYMKQYRDFENDPVRYSYSEGTEFLARLHENKQHYVPIIDSAIYAPNPENVSDAYPPFGRGVAEDAFILNPDKSLYIGEVWPGYTVFPDWIGALFNGTGTNRWWSAEIAEYYSKIKFDGIWIDMSEVSSFCVGSCGSNDLSLNPVHPPFSLPGEPGNVDYTYPEGFNLTNATEAAAASSSASAQSAAASATETADVSSMTSYLSTAPTPGALSFSLFGIPMFGVDTCGFSGNADLELCSRWMQLSAFFPFYRNHNVLEGAPQEPYVWAAVADASKAAMRIRYALLPYLYTTFYLSHATGATTMRALAWDFPDEPWLAAADRQFLLGGALLVTPCLVQGAATVDGVFPGVGSGTLWYDWYNQTVISDRITAGQNVTIDAPLGHIPVYVRGGYAIPMQEPGLTTADVRASPWSVLVALDGGGKAAGGLYLDDGESLVPDTTTWVDFTAAQGSLKAVPKGEFIDTNPLGNVTVMGIKRGITKVKFNGIALKPTHWDFDASKHLLNVRGLDSSTRIGSWRTEWILSWS
ncbi:putative alpha-glucosidase precursor protein [Eutypa lata UCREL1]|uniref:alpha-glucosidase n=1 Tax=Eutypa lata (strain UCR-EL1) TaxID=1287681 RepID=M7TJI0_EUTLA|nr:putative alpha-glucosidase precursor protein [Eutypa lata UCREL1]